MHAKPEQRVLVTGSTGFTGRYMCDELKAAGYQVFGIGSQRATAPASRYYQADLQDFSRLSAIMAEVKPDVIIHLAALAFVGHGNVNDFYQVNLLGTRNLLEAVAVCGKRPDCVLLASSANVYGNQSQGVLTEGSQPLPVNDYAVSKLAMEHMARTWLDKLPIVIARPFNYTGIGQAENFLLPKIVKHFRRQSSVIELGNLDVWRDFSDVRSVVAAYHGLIKASPAGQTFNVASGQAYSLREILSLCEEITGHHLEVKVNSAFVRASEVKMLCGDASRLKACIGRWCTVPLRETLEWMLTEGL